jgi:eukaryotic-like serine/threonine-protein kinase
MAACTLATVMARHESGVAELPGYRDFVAIARSEGSEVYRAYQEGVDRPVAVKVLLLDDPEAVARFQRELDITVQLGRQHPHIVTVIDTGTTSDGRPCIVMEHYDRGSLHDRLRARGPLPWDEVLAAGAVVADALSFAHRHGVLHRDVKPQNILVLPTSYVVADFGIARRIDAARTTSVEWFSFRHAAPQVLDGEAPAVADDIWSVGSTLFTLLDGMPPFATGKADEDTALAYMRRVRTGQRRTLDRHDVPAGLVAVIDRCMQHERADRFPDAAALREALTTLTGEARAWAPPSPVAPVALTTLTGEARAWAPPSPVAPVAPVHSTGTAPSRRVARLAEGPQVVPVQPAAVVPQAAPPLPTTAVPPPSPAQPPAPPAPREAPVRGRQAVVSPSAAGQVVAPPWAPGRYAGAEETIGPASTAPPPAEPSGPAPARRGGVRRVLLSTAVALLVGGLLGIGVTWVAGLVRDDAGDAGDAGAAGATGQARTPGGSAPAAAQPTVPSRVNPQIGPVLTVSAVNRTTVRLRWQDRSGGRAQFVVVRVRCPAGGTSECGSARTVGQPLQEGTTEFVVDKLSPATAPYCFLVLAVSGEENAPSAPGCVNPPAAG